MSGEDQYILNFEAPVTDPRMIIRTRDVSPARNTDPETSHEAAEKADISGSQRLLVYEYFALVLERGATDYECGRDLRILRTSAGKRRKELEDMGFIERTDDRRETDTGCSAIVWKLRDLYITFEREKETYQL